MPELDEMKTNNFNGEKTVQYNNWIEIIEIVCVLWFTLEYLLRKLSFIFYFFN